MKVYVDDLRTPDVEYWDIIARNHDVAIILLQTNKVTKISLDHDLGEDSKTGYDIAKWIEERVATDKDFVCPEIRVHSANPVGRNNIFQSFASINKILYYRHLEKEDETFKKYITVV